MPKLAVLLAFSCQFCLLFSCKDDTIVISATISRSNGQSLLQADPPWESLDIWLQQDEQAMVHRQWTSVDESLRLSLPVSRSVLTRVRVQAERGEEHLLGSLPLFYAGWAPMGLRVLLAAPSECETIAGLALQLPRQDAGFAKVGATALVLGGEAEGQSSVAEFIDLLSMQAWDYVDDLGVSLGKTQITALDSRYALVVPEQGEPFVYDLAIPSRVDSSLAVDSVSLDSSSLGIVYESGQQVQLLGNLGQGPSTGIQLCLPEALMFETEKGE